MTDRPTTTAPRPTALTIAAAAHRHKVSERTIRRLISAGRLPVHHPDRRPLIEQAALDAHFTQHPPMRGTPSTHPVHAAIVARGLRRADVARQVGISTNLLNQVIQGQKRSWPLLRSRLSTLLELPVDQLFPDLSPASDGHR